MSVREKVLRELMEWALRYAKAKRVEMAEIDDVVQELVRAVMKSRWRSLEYAKETMRHRLTDLHWQKVTVQKHTVYLEDEKEMSYTESARQEAWGMVHYLKDRLPSTQKAIINRMLKGYTVKEICALEGISRMTIHRCMKESRRILAPSYAYYY